LKSFFEKEYTVEQLIFEDIKVCGFSKFDFREKYSWKKFQGHGLVAKIYSNVACGDML